MNALMIKATNNRYRPATEDEILEQARQITASRFYGTRYLGGTAEVREFLDIHLKNLEHEVFVVIFLSNKHRVIGYEAMFRGTVDGASVYPREVIKAALKHNASALVFAHNHPSGVREPSGADMQITERLKDAASMFGIRVLDHFIVGDGPAMSFAERGLI